MNKYGIFVGDGNCDFDANEGVILENLELYGGLNAFATNKIHLRNVKSSTDPNNEWYAVHADPGAEVIIESGEYSSVATKGKNILSACTSADDSSVLVKGGTFIAPEGVGIASSSANLTIEGGSWNLDPSNWVDLESFDVTFNDDRHLHVYQLIRMWVEYIHALW